MRTTGHLGTTVIGFERMKLETLRGELRKPKWNNDFFGEVIQRYPHEFTHAKVDGEPGIRDLHPSSPPP
jgi:hypothetical protein